MGVAGLVLRRLVGAAILIFGIIALTFGLSRFLPGDPARLLAGTRASPEVVEAVRERLGLEDPVLEQFERYLGDLTRGDLGVSIVTRRPVATDIAAYLPATVELISFAVLFGSVTGLALGVMAGLRRGSARDTAARSFGTLGLSVPDFWMAILLQLLFFSALGWFPLGDRLPIAVTPPPAITGFYTIDALLAGDLALMLQSLHHLVLPAFVLSLPMVGLVLRTVRASTIEVAGSGYVLHARAKGLSHRRILLRHIARNAMMPAVTIIGLEIGLLLSGAVLVELVFNWPGVGRYTAQAIRAVDYNAILGMTVIAATAYVMINLIVDLIYLWLDPRLRDAS